jgi:hypothetical protein
MILMKELTHKDVCPYFEENCIYIGCVCPKYLAYEKVNTPGELEKYISNMNHGEKEDAFFTMINIQKNFSSKFFNASELSDEEISRWIKQYDLCIADEITEVHEHLDVFENIYGKNKTNIKELQKEFIDIWHFVMDLFIVGSINKDIYYYYEEDVKQKNKDEVDFLKFVFITEKENLEKDKKIIIDSESIDSISVLITTGYLLSALRKLRQQINWKHWKKQKKELNIKDIHRCFANIISQLIKCFLLVGIDEKNLYDIYIKKNIENVFRQQFGY